MSHAFYRNWIIWPFFLELTDALPIARDCTVHSRHATAWIRHMAGCEGGNGCKGAACAGR